MLIQSSLIFPNIFSAYNTPCPAANQDRGGRGGGRVHPVQEGSGVGRGGLERRGTTRRVKRENAATLRSRLVIWGNRVQRNVIRVKLICKDHVSLPPSCHIPYSFPSAIKSRLFCTVYYFGRTIERGAKGEATPVN